MQLDVVHAVGFWSSWRSELTVTQPSPLYLTRSQASEKASGSPTGHSSISHTFAFSHLRKQVKAVWLAWSVGLEP